MQPIFELINEIVSTLDRFDAERCLENICTNLLAVTEGGACFIFLMDPEEGAREVTAVQGEAKPAVILPLQRARELAGKVLERGDRLVLDDGRDGGEGDGREEAVVALPLKAFDALIGALVVVRHGRAFDEVEVGALQPIANIVALALPKGEIDGFAKLAEICIRFLEEKDRYTHGHSLRVMQYSLLLADSMELGMRDRRELRLCALLHDIGKVIIKGSILSKSEALTGREM
ncbi:MAG: HD-GYP domain-containing protein, partial [Planctomycetota bacterium]